MRWCLPVSLIEVVLDESPWSGQGWVPKVAQRGLSFSGEELEEVALFWRSGHNSAVVQAAHCRKWVEG